MSKITPYFPVGEDYKVVCAVIVPVVGELRVYRQSNLVLVENSTEILSKLVYVKRFARGVRVGRNYLVP